jgi:hypothetical protein
VEFTDAHGRRWLVHDKAPVFVEPPGGFSASSSYPMPTLIACDVESRQLSPDRELATVVLRHTEATTGEVQFEVEPQSLATF